LRRRRLLLAVLLAVLAVPGGAPGAGGQTTLTGRNFLLAGLYPSSPWSGNQVAAVGAAAGKKLSLGGYFVQVGDNASNIDHVLEHAWSVGATPLVNVEFPAGTSAAAIAGQQAWTNTISTFAANVKLWLDKGGGRRLFIAPMAEMNGNWVSYGMDPANFKVAYSKFINAFANRGIGGSQVRWVFAPNGWSTPPGRIVDYYPGHDLVDVIGISAYNWGNWTPDPGWQTPQQAMGPFLNELRAFAPNKPYLITQTASGPSGGNRDQWLRDMFAYLAADPNVIGMLYFNIHNSSSEPNWIIYDGNNLAAGFRDGMQAATTKYQFPLDAWFQSGPIPFKPWNGTFWDDDASPHQANIEWLVAQGITSGCAPQQYCPTSPVTREQMATFLARTLNLPPAGKDYFSDDGNSPHQGDINRIAAAGITTGCGGGRFCPRANVSRWEMAVFLVKGFRLPNTSTNYFWDDNGHPNENSINRVAAAGVTAGCAAGRYCPYDWVTREQMATFLRKAAS
jgi:hypothetical protein